MTPPGAPAFRPPVFDDAPAPTTPAPASKTPANGAGTKVPKQDWRSVARAADKRPSVQTTDEKHVKEVSKFVSENPEHTRRFGWIYLDTVGIDERIQRPINQGEVNRIAKEFDPAALGTITLSARVDEAGNTTYWVIDGQQRRAGALKAGFDGPVRADIHYGLTLADEAKLFRELNFRRAVQPVQLFKTALIEEDPDALAVDKILRDLGIAFGTPRGFMGAKSALRLVHRRNGETTLRWAFTQVQKIYDGDGRGGCYDAAVVEAFFHLYNHFGSRIDETNLYNKLASKGGGTADLLGQARTIKATRNGRLVINVIRAILARYNQGKHAGSKAALPDWTVDASAEKDIDTDAE